MEFNQTLINFDDDERERERERAEWERVDYLTD